MIRRPDTALPSPPAAAARRVRAGGAAGGGAEDGDAAATVSAQGLGAHGDLVSSVVHRQSAVGGEPARRATGRSPFAGDNGHCGHCGHARRRDNLRRWVRSSGVATGVHRRRRHEEVSRCPDDVSLAGQLLALQVLIVLGVLRRRSPRCRSPSPASRPARSESRRALAQRRERSPPTRGACSASPAADRSPTTGSRPAAEASRALSGARSVLLVRHRRHGGHVRRPRTGRARPLGFARPERGRGAGRGPAWWTPVRARSCRRRCRCSPRRRARIVGVAVVERGYPSVLERLARRGAQPADLPGHRRRPRASSARCCWPAGSSARRSGWSRRRSPGWWSTARRCCTASRRA